jgi:hypothetical protein
MNPVYFEYLKIALLFSIVGLLNQILHYMKLIWNNIFDMHIVIVRKEDPRLFGGKG